MTQDRRRLETEILVIGTGIAGLTFALRAAEYADVLLVTKKARVDSNTNFAQGGIAAVFAADDTYEQHVTDTLQAGAGLCHHERVRALVRSGRRAVQELIDWGVEFSRSDGRLALGREGGHSRARIVHSKDLTGPAIEGALLQAIADHPRVQLREHHMALDLAIAGEGGEGGEGGDRRCAGAYVLDSEAGELIEVSARATLLASGGAATIYRHTTNPSIATGDGVAMALRAGAVVANMEFVQFHPTALYPAEERAFLITEALRGAGAVIRNAAGEPFVADYHRDGDLAPRDIVARALHAELRASGAEHAWLDATALAPELLESRFPNILRGCRERGIDPRAESIPIVPAAHYVCGGVWTDESGSTSLTGLYAVGECACTGVHGANRLASNSLLEAVVFAEAAARRIRSHLPGLAPTAVNGDSRPELRGAPRDRMLALRERLRRLMWEGLGIVRSGPDIRSALDELARLREEWRAVRTSGPSMDPQVCLAAAELTNMLDVATLVGRCAAWRRESRGLHYDVETPYRNNETFLRDSIVIPSTHAGSARV